MVFKVGEAYFQLREAEKSASEAKDRFNSFNDKMDEREEAIRKCRADGNQWHDGVCVEVEEVPPDEVAAYINERGGVPPSTVTATVPTSSGPIEAEVLVPDAIDLLGGARTLFERAEEVTRDRLVSDYLAAFCTESDSAESAQACSDAAIAMTERAPGKQTYVLIDNEPSETEATACLIIHATGLPENSEIIARLCMRPAGDDEASACVGATKHDRDGTNHYHAAFLGDPDRSVGYQLFYDDAMQDIVSVQAIEDPIAQLQFTNMVSGAGLNGPYSCMSLLTDADALVSVAGCSYSAALLRLARPGATGGGLINGHGGEHAVYDDESRALSCAPAPTS